MQLKENTDKLSRGQIIGLNYVNEFEQRIPRDEIKLIQSKIRKRIRKLDPKYVVTVCGSFRREAETSGQSWMNFFFRPLLPSTPDDCQPFGMKRTVV